MQMVFCILLGIEALTLCSFSMDVSADQRSVRKQKKSAYKKLSSPNEKITKRKPEQAHVADFTFGLWV